MDRCPNMVIWQFSPEHKGHADSDTAARPASHTASQSLRHPAIIGVHPRTPFTPAAALSGGPEITDTEAVIASWTSWTVTTGSTHARHFPHNFGRFLGDRRHQARRQRMPLGQSTPIGPQRSSGLGRVRLPIRTFWCVSRATSAQPEPEVTRGHSSDEIIRAPPARQGSKPR